MNASGAATYLATVYFDHGVRDESEQGACAFQTIGACRFDPCPPESPRLRSGVAGANAPNPNEVTVHGSTASLVFLPQPDGTYADQTGTTPLWTGNDAMAFDWFASAPGGDDFGPSAVSFQAPSYATIDATSALATTPASLSTASDLTFAWTPDGDQGVNDQVELTVLSEGPQRNELRCTFDVSVKQATISGDVFVPMPHGATVHYELKSIHRVKTTVNGWRLEYLLSSRVRTGNGFVEGVTTLE